MRCDDEPSVAAVKGGAKEDGVMTRKRSQCAKWGKKEQWRQRAPWAWLTVGFGEASHRDWLETQACCWVHQKQGHCADRQLVQLKDKAGGLPSATWLPIPVPGSADPGHRSQHSETRSCSTSELPRGAGRFAR